MVSARKCKVAVLMGNSHLSHRAFAKNFDNQVRKYDLSNLYDVAYYSSSVKKVDIQCRVRDLIAKQNNVIIAYGQRVTESVKEVLDAAGGHPLIFVGVKDPVTMGIAQSLLEPGLYATGVIQESVPALFAAEKLIFLAPYIRKFIIPYWVLGEGGFLVKQVAEIKYFLIRHGFHVESIPIQESMDAVNVIAQHAGQQSCVLLLEGCLSGELLHKISYICWEKMTVLCVDGRAGINKGASCSYGNSKIGFAREAFLLLQRYYELQIPMGCIPVKQLSENAVFTINVNILRMIGVPHDIIMQFCAQPNIEMVNEWIDAPR